MACIKGPTLPAPTLPAPFTVDPPDLAASLSFDPKLCCKLPPIPPQSVNLPIPGIILDPIAAALKDAVAQVNAYLDQIQLKCPRE